MVPSLVVGHTEKMENPTKVCFFFQMTQAFLKIGSIIILVAALHNCQSLHRATLGEKKNGFENLEMSIKVFVSMSIDTITE